MKETFKRILAAVILIVMLSGSVIFGLWKGKVINIPLLDDIFNNTTTEQKDG